MYCGLCEELRQEESMGTWMECWMEISKGTPMTGRMAGTLLGAGDLVGGSKTRLLGFCEGCDGRLLDDWELGTLLGAGDFVGGSEASLLGICIFVGGSEASLLGICDGWELGTLLGARNFVGGYQTTLLGFCKGCDDGFHQSLDGVVVFVHLSTEMGNLAYSFGNMIH
jgi:hypothetical protein